MGRPHQGGADFAILNSPGLMMPSVFEKSSEFACSADELFALYADPEFQRSKAIALGATAAACVIEQATKEYVVIRLETTRPSFGGRREEFATMRMELDRVTRGSSWIQTVRGHERRARVEGTSTVSELSGNRARLTVEGSIDIRIPLFGRIIEGKILGAIEGIADREAAFIRAQLAARL